jgi:putative ABC transport system permease protein
MIRHLFRMVWNRKRTNFLIIVEIFFSFIVLFAVVLFAVYYADNYRRPLGYSYQNVWNISIERTGDGDTQRPTTEVAEGGQEERLAPGLIRARQLFLVLRELSEIESFAGVSTPPYAQSTTGSAYKLNGREIKFNINSATDSLAETLGLSLVRGRWFGREDDGANYKPVIINERMSREVFGDGDPIGQQISPEKDWQGKPVKIIERVIGVITDYRKDGEFAGLGNYIFQRHNLDDPKSWPPSNIVVRVQAGTTAAFEEKLMAKLQSVARDWSFEIDPVSEMREVSLTIYLAPIISAGLVSAFLMIMVALGLTGVLWQNVTQRTKEIGLRRAKGATAGNIYLQILGELLVITSFGLVLGVAVVVQFPLLDLIGFISDKVYIYSLLLSILVIYVLTLICGLYPSRLATRVQPAEALHYE